MKAVKDFVRNVMGCRCPEEVFEYIEVDSGVQLPEGITIMYKINVGNRLLIYIVDGGNPEVLNNFDIIVTSGLRERDGRGFNRLRLVITAGSLGKSEMERLENMIRDEKVHIHFVEKESLEIFNPS